MGDRSHIKQLCSKFKGKEYELIEFQNRLETAIFPPELEGFKYSVLNEIEEIRFTKLEENFHHLGLKVVEKILK
ncbi:hypothetical protein, partial [Paenibacillus campinasensis]